MTHNYHLAEECPKEIYSRNVDLKPRRSTNGQKHQIILSLGKRPRLGLELTDKTKEKYHGSNQSVLKL